MPAYAAIGMGLQILGSGKSIIDSINQRKDAREAERRAAAAAEEAKRRLEVNRMEEVQVPLESYRQAMREQTAQQMQNIEALQEADTRNLLGGVGKVQAVAGVGTEAQRQAMEQALFNREKMIADEQSRLDTSLANINLQEATGYQQMATDLTEQSAANLSRGIGGIGGALSTFQKQQSLYGNETKRAAIDVLKNSGLSEDLINDMTPQEIQEAAQGNLPLRSEFTIKIK